MDRRLFLKRRGFLWFALVYWLLVASLAGTLLWFGAVLAWPPVASYVAIQSYQSGRCTILTKDIRTYSSYNQDTGTDDYQYAPDFSFSVSATSQRSFRGKGYGRDQALQPYQASAQAILDQYQIGKMYPCWYDSANPSQAILTREGTEWILLLPGSILLLTGLAWMVRG